MTSRRSSRAKLLKADDNRGLPKYIKRTYARFAENSHADRAARGSPRHRAHRRGPAKRPAEELIEHMTAEITTAQRAQRRTALAHPYHDSDAASRSIVRHHVAQDQRWGVSRPTTERVDLERQTIDERRAVSPIRVGPVAARRRTGSQVMCAPSVRLAPSFCVRSQGRRYGQPQRSGP